MPNTPPKNNGKTQKMNRNTSVKEAGKILKEIRTRIEGKPIGPQMANVNKFAAIIQKHGENSSEAKDFIKQFEAAKGKLTNTSKTAKSAVSISMKTLAEAMKEAAAPAPGAPAAAASSASAKKRMDPLQAQIAAAKQQLAMLQTAAKEQRAQKAAEKKLKEEFAHLEEQAAKNLEGMEIDEHNVKRLAHIRGLGVGLSGANFIKVKKAFSRKYMTKKAKTAKTSNGNAKPASTRKNNSNAKSANKANSVRSEGSNGSEGSNLNLGE
jgi:hypothetical protein